METNDYDVVIEFGSGTSTVLMAKVLDKIANRRQGKPPVRQVAFEHQAEYRARTGVSLQQAGLGEKVQLGMPPYRLTQLPMAIPTPTTTATR